MRQVGIRSAPIGLASFDRVLRAVGRVSWDESALVDVSLKVGGWVEKLEADTVGVRVERGRPLLWLYSPELYAAQQEYLSALRSQRASGGLRSDAIVRAARTRLRLWDLSETEIDAVARRGTAAEALPIRSPASGVVIEKDVTLGAAVEPGRRLFRIAPQDRVWIEAELQEDELEGVAPGDSAVVTLASLPGRRFEAKVAYVYPYLERATRSARVRLTLENADLALRPDMYANVELRVPRGERLLVPATAVLYAGPRRVVFVDLGEGRLQPREITIGAGNGESYEVLSGLAPGERVVVSAQFLLDSESRLRGVARPAHGSH
jgi:Cu(I)/Ag(I) efflux system membrane fusion protein